MADPNIKKILKSKKTESPEHDFFDNGLMQELQDRFCAANNVYAVCFSRSNAARISGVSSKYTSFVT